MLEAHPKGKFLYLQENPEKSVVKNSLKNLNLPNFVNLYTIPPLRLCVGATL